MEKEVIKKHHQKNIPTFAPNFVERLTPYFCSNAWPIFIDLVVTQKYQSEEGRTTNYVR